MGRSRYSTIDATVGNLRDVDSHLLMNSSEIMTSLARIPKLNGNADKSSLMPADVVVYDIRGNAMHILRSRYADLFGPISNNCLSSISDESLSTLVSGAEITMEFGKVKPDEVTEGYAMFKLRNNGISRLVSFVYGPIDNFELGYGWASYPKLRSKTHDVIPHETASHLPGETYIITFYPKHIKVLGRRYVTALCTIDSEDASYTFNASHLMLPLHGTVAIIDRQKDNHVSFDRVHTASEKKNSLRKIPNHKLVKY